MKLRAVLAAMSIFVLVVSACGDDESDPAPVDNNATANNNGSNNGEKNANANTNNGENNANNTDAPVEPINLDGDIPYDTLSEYRFFVGDMQAQVPNEGVLPYTVAAPLWADQAGKGRFIVMPPEGKVTLEDDDEGWVWPEGAILIKSFFFNLDRQLGDDGPVRIIETRLLRREADGWESYIYVWNDDETEATLTKLGGRRNVDFTDVDGQPATQLYLVPNTEECKSCHEIDDVLTPLGLSISQMNRDIGHDDPEAPTNQLAWLESEGVFAEPIADRVDALPALSDPFDDSLDLASRARSYLHGNCAHCHREGGGGGRSGLRLVWSEEDENRFGICKSPVAAGSGSGGRAADIVPGHPEDSIMVFRMMSSDPEIKMPELPNLLPDTEGVELVSAWIAAMEPAGCP